MAQRNSSGRGGTATRTKQAGNRTTPGAPEISESEISRMRVDEIRGRLRRHGVSGVSALRKADLVKTLVKALRAERRGGGAAKRGTGPAGRAAGGRKRAEPIGAKRTAPAGRAAAGTTKAAGGAAKAPARGGGARTGAGTSRSVRSAQQITSLADRPERPGRSLVTSNHEVIQRWARERAAKPATIAGTEREGRAGVLTFNLPGYRESSRIREISWNEWFRTFDERRLNLIYQERLRDGRPSNFFRTESPVREDG